MSLERGQTLNRNRSVSRESHICRTVSRVRSHMSDREFLTEPCEEEEEEERASGAYMHPAVRSYMYSPMGEFAILTWLACSPLSCFVL